MDRIAIISDIHGNLEALKTVLQDINLRGIEKIYCLGDIVAKGCNSEECVNLIKENCEVVIRGNCDRNMSHVRDLSNETELERTRINWNQNRLTKESMDYLQNLPFCHEFYMSGSLIRMFHASSVRDNEVVINRDVCSKLYEMFLPSDKTETKNIADIVIFGHLHHSFLEKIYNKTLINVGSVGNSFDPIRDDKRDSNEMEITQAFYLIIEGELGTKEYKPFSYQFVRVPYDIDKELERNQDNLELENYTFELKHGRYRDMKKINDNFERLGIDLNK